MLHSNPNTHAHKDLNKESERPSENTFRAQGVAYNPVGSTNETSSANPAYTAASNPTSNYDNLNNQSSTFNTNTTNPITKPNTETIGGGALGLQPHNDFNTSSNTNAHNSSNFTMGNVNHPSDGLHGSYPINSSNTTHDAKQTGQIGHSSTLNNQSIGNTTHDKLSHNTTDLHNSTLNNQSIGATTHDKLSHNTTDLHNSTTNNNSKVAPGVTHPPLTNEYPGVYPSRSSNTPLETTTGKTTHGNSLHDQKLNSNAHGHTGSTVPTAHNHSSVADEVYGAEFGKVPIREQTITGDHKHDAHTHTTNNPERIGESHIHNQPISGGVKNSSHVSGPHSHTTTTHTAGKPSHPALDSSHDLDAVDTKPSKIGGYMDKMKGAIHESVGKALKNEEMIEKGTLEKAQGEQKILLAQNESKTKHH